MCWVRCICKLSLLKIWKLLHTYMQQMVPSALLQLKPTLRMHQFHSTLGMVLHLLLSFTSGYYCQQVQGPWGGLGGGYFYDGPATFIKALKISFDSRPVIWSLGVEYNIDGKSFYSSHGELGHAKQTEIILRHPDEYLQQIEGSYGIVPVTFGGASVTGITSLTFKSNLQSYGPYGVEGQIPFKTDSGTIVGLFGRSGMCLDQIGVFIVNPVSIQVRMAVGLVGYWGFDEVGGTIANDTSGGGNHATLSGRPTRTVGKVMASLHFDGIRTFVDVHKNVLNTSGSYSVATWVQLTDTSDGATAVSQDGTHISGFFLQYTRPSIGSDGGRFAFTLVGFDSTTSNTVRAKSPFKPLKNVWYHLVGVHDAGANLLKLYVDGALVDTVSVPPAWNATGETVIGRAKWAGANVQFWNGKIDDVRVYNRVITDSDIRDVYNAAPTITPIRPPAIPLIVRSPYVSTWQTTDILPGTWSTFWTGSIKALTGMARIDGIPYLFMGNPVDYIGNQQIMTQTQLEITPTQSRYTFQGGGVTLNVNFLSPVEATDIRRLSMPFGYVFVQAQSNDGNDHDVQLYFDISAEWAHGDSATPVTWNNEQVRLSNGKLTVLSVTPNLPQLLTETNECASWGVVVWATKSHLSMTSQIGADFVVRSLEMKKGALNNSVDSNKPRAIDDNWPVFAFSHDLKIVGGEASAPIVFVLGHVREPAVSYLSNNVPSLWQSYWSSWQAMLAFAYDDAGSALDRANALDRSITEAATQASGVNYAALCSLVLRQAFGAVELVGTINRTWLVLKEISSNGNMMTVDVLYPAFPVFYYTNPYLLRLLLDPILAYSESGRWPKTYCVHDLGTHYPNATGHDDGIEEDMPIEESANMLIMASVYLHTLSAGDANAYATAHYTILKQWADYLVPNTLDPGNQMQTDDFTSPIALNSNLALKGILGVGAMGQIANFAGNHSDAQYYARWARSLIKQWITKSQDSSNQHLKLAYDQDDTWSLKYNVFSDKLLGLNLVPDSVLQEEAAWYIGKHNQYGVPLDNRYNFTKADWEMWTAASTNNIILRDFLIDSLYQFANTSSSRVPFTDWFNTITNLQEGFQARPVIGGIFSILARIKSGN